VPTPIDPAVIAAFQKNIFQGAHAAIGDWDAFPWHRGDGGVYQTSKPQSSQAIGIDVFGTLQAMDEADRNASLDAIAISLGVPGGGPWSIYLEWCDCERRLKELTPTQVDAVARGRKALIFFEVKFTETDGGGCSQVRKLTKGVHAGKVQCSGHYQTQTNPVNQIESRCALSGKGISYWDTIPRVFKYGSELDSNPCPFKGPWFQWMRNLVLCHEVAQANDLRPAFVVAYADAPGLPVAEKARKDEWRVLLDALRPGAVEFRAASLQGLVEAASLSDCLSEGGRSTLSALKGWIERKISTVAAKRSG
jgi:hypothetical protein